MSGIGVHVDDRDQLVTSGEACHDIQAGARHTQDLRQEFDQRIIGFVIGRRRGDADLDRPVVEQLDDLIAAGARRDPNCQRRPLFSIVQVEFAVRQASPQRE